MYTQPDKTQFWKRSATLTIVTVVVVTVLVGLLSSSSRSKEANLSLATKTNLVSAASDIKNGTIANALTWNFVVLLTHGQKGCTGVLVSATKILTAGHCCGGTVNEMKEIRALHADVANPTGQTDFTEYTIQTQFRISNPKYKFEKDKEVEGQKQYSPQNDLCVVTLKKPGISLQTGYPKLFQDIPVDGTNLRIAGFGMSSNKCGALDGYALRTATVPKTKCTHKVFEKKENSVALYNDASVQNKLICIAPDQQGRSPCCGDSGGPLMDINLKNLYGILSDGYWRPCNGGPAWYSNLLFADFKKFIQDETK